MRRTILWIVGEPGIGKTTFVRSLLQHPVSLVEKPKWTLSHQGRMVLAGHYSGDKFDGADRVPYNGVAAALDFWKEKLSQKAELTIFDGDRFSNRNVVVGFFGIHGAFMGVTDLKCLHLTGAPIVAEVRRTARGGHQNASWVLGRKTKSLRFSQGFSSVVRAEINDPKERWDVRATLKLLDLSWVLPVQPTPALDAAGATD